MDLESRYFKLKSLIGSSTLVAVSKGQSMNAIRELYKLGHRVFGENYLQELEEKAMALREDCPEIQWHYLGRIQRNKFKRILAVSRVVHSIDRIELFPFLESGGTFFFLQVNIDQAPTKTGFSVDEVCLRYQTLSIPTQRRCLGLMCIPDPGTDEEIRKKFIQMRTLSFSLPEGSRNLSMGMSSDYEIALQEGSNYVRVGTALFGERKAKENK